VGRVRLNPASVEIRQARHEEERNAGYTLRWEVLRAPWQQPRGSERDELDGVARHYLAIDARGQVLATGRIHTIAADTAQIRYMAVRPGHERRGLGTRLLAALEADAVTNGASRIVLHAREASVGFYRRCGYRVIRGSHRLFDAIQHYEMEKTVSGKTRSGDTAR